MGRHMLIELAWLAGALLVAVGITWGAAWAYPLGAGVIWAVGAVAIVVVVAINLPKIRDARVRDRAGD